MLKGITWGQFSVFMLVVTGFYYLYVALRYYRTEVLAWVAHRGGRASASSGRDEGGNNKDAQGELTPQAAAGRAEVFEKEGPGDGSNAQFQLMQRAIGVIRLVIAQGIENKLDRENLLDHIREVLGDYRQLRETEYAETISNFLVRECFSELSLELGEQELSALWK